VFTLPTIPAHIGTNGIPVHRKQRQPSKPPLYIEIISIVVMMNLSFISMQNEFYFEDTDLTVKLSDYPPAPVIWAYQTVDSVCWVLQCQSWRQWVGVPKTGSWLSEEYKVPDHSSQFEPLLSLQQFRQEQSPPEQSFFQSLVSYVQQPDTNLANPITMEGFGAVLIIMLLLRTIKRVAMPMFSKFGRMAALQSHGRDWVAANEIRITKFGEYVYRLCSHTVFSLYGSVFLFEPWWGTEKIFDGYPKQSVDTTMTWYYLLQLAYNADAFISLLEMSVEFRKGRLRWSATKRGDFAEMLAHHVATNLLVFGSSALRLGRIGCMIFFIHDVSDVPVDLSKLANFVKWKVTTVTCFAIMTFTWMYTRLYVLPFRILYRAFMNGQKSMALGLSPLYYICYRHLFFAGVFSLIVLHAVWFTMFMKMLRTLLLKNEVHDYSEHRNGESTTTATTDVVANGRGGDDKKSN
jgi:TLC domain